MRILGPVESADQTRCRGGVFVAADAGGSHLVGGLGHAEGAHHRRREHVVQRLRRFRGERGAAAADEAQRGWVPSRRIGLVALQQDLVNRRHRGVPGGADGVDVVPERVRREPSASGQQHGAPGCQGRQQRGDQPVTVIERHHRDGRVLRAEPVFGDDGPHRAGDVGARPGNHLRHTGGPAGEHDHRVVRLEPLGRPNSLGWVAWRCPAGLTGRHRRGRRSPRSATTAASIHRRGPSPSTSTTRAPAASLRARCSLTGRAGSSGTTIRSARDAANRPTTNSALLAARSATRSPGSRPPRFNWPGQIVDQPDQVAVAESTRSAVTTSAGASGCRLAASLDEVGDAGAQGSVLILRPCRATSVSSNTDPLTIDNPWLLKGR